MGSPLSDRAPAARASVGTAHADEVLTLLHAGESSVAGCGVQLWRGSLLLADWLLDCAHGWPRCETEMPAYSEAVGLELGCGAGLGSLILRRLCSVVFATDGDAAACELARRNIELNNATRCHDEDTRFGEIRARRFNWDESNSLLVRYCSSEPGAPAPHPAQTQMATAAYCGKVHAQDQCALAAVSVIIAADVLYDSAATVAFVRLLPQLLLSPGSATTTSAPGPQQEQTEQQVQQEDKQEEPRSGQLEKQQEQKKKKRWVWLTLERRMIFGLVTQKVHAPAVELFFELVSTGAFEHNP